MAEPTKRRSALAQAIADRRAKDAAKAAKAAKARLAAQAKFRKDAAAAIRAGTSAKVRRDVAAIVRRERSAILNGAVANLLLMKGATDGMILAYDQETEICVLPAWIPAGEDLDAEVGSPPLRSARRVPSLRRARRTPQRVVRLLRSRQGDGVLPKVRQGREARLMATPDLAKGEGRMGRLRRPTSGNTIASGPCMS